LQVYRSRKGDQIMTLLVLILVLALLRTRRTKLKIEIDLKRKPEEVGSSNLLTSPAPSIALLASG